MFTWLSEMVDSSLQILLFVANPAQQLFNHIPKIRKKRGFIFHVFLSRIIETNAYFQKKKVVVYCKIKNLF